MEKIHNPTDYVRRKWLSLLNIWVWFIYELEKETIWTDDLMIAATRSSPFITYRKMITSMISVLFILESSYFLSTRAKLKHNI
ncbi:MAG: hypothetical protein HKM87_06995 [Ignavibacteriaceae bacterium]|nr:hypothetical protein [Ignavibacteriaceae bacterium]